MLGLDLAQLLLGAQIDGAEPLALAAHAVELGLDVGDVGQLGAGLDLGERRRPPPGSISSISRISCSMSARRRLAPSKRSSARAASSRAAPMASSAARASRSASACAVSACGELVGGGAARRFRGLDLADQRACASPRRPRARRRGLRARSWPPRTRVSRVAICEAAPSLRSLQPSRSAADLHKPPRRELRLARQRLRLGAHLGELRAVGLDLAAHVGELRLDLGGGRQSASARSASPRAVAASSRLAGEPGFRLGQRREPRRVAAGLALGVGMLVRARPALRAAARASCRGHRLRPRPRRAPRLRRLATAARLASTSLAHDPAIRPRCRRGGSCRRGAAPRRSARWRRPRSRPSARGRHRARRAAGRA